MSAAAPEVVFALVAAPGTPATATVAAVAASPPTLLTLELVVLGSVTEDWPDSGTIEVVNGGGRGAGASPDATLDFKTIGDGGGGGGGPGLRRALVMLDGVDIIPADAAAASCHRIVVRCKSVGPRAVGAGERDGRSMGRRIILEKYHQKAALSE